MTRCTSGDGFHVVDRWDDVFDALRTEPRRQLVDALMDVSIDEAVPLPDAAINPNLAVDRKQLLIQLRHRHLPLLSDARFVRWDDEPLRAFRGPRFDQVAIVFECLSENADRIPDELVDAYQILEQEREQEREQSSV